MAATTSCHVVWVSLLSIASKDGWWVLLPIPGMALEREKAVSMARACMPLLVLCSVGGKQSDASIHSHTGLGSCRLIGSLNDWGGPE